jgi:SET domain-containing protein
LRLSVEERTVRVVNLLQGLFPITSILNHACTANTICYAREDFTFVCRAVTDIKKGE